MATKTLSLRISEDDYQSLSLIAKEEKGDISKATREFLSLGRIMLAIEKYKKREVSIEKAAKIAGVSISKIMDIFKEYGVSTNLEYEDYLVGLNGLRMVW